jgi:hypothetical protein
MTGARRGATATRASSPNTCPRTRATARSTSACTTSSARRAGPSGSDDAGATWADIAGGLPSNFGFPVVVDPADPDSAYVIPVTTADRVVPDGRVLVWETRDAGATWTPHGDGLPQEDAYLQVLRQAFAGTGEGRELELYFGANSGELFGSGDAGATWFTVARRLPPIASVRADRLRHGA